MDIDEVIEKYGNVKLHFYRYYKYSFFYKGVADDGAVIILRYGGDSSEIYTHEIIIPLEDYMIKYIDEFSEFEIKLDNKIIFEHSLY